MKNEIEEIKQYELPKLMNTGIIPIDFGLGGLEPNSFIQLVGESGCGKTLISLQLARVFCNQQKKVIYVDNENSIDENMLQNLGLINYFNKEFIYIKESTFKNVESVLDHYINNDDISLVIIDSIPTLINDGYLNLDSNGIKIDNNNSNYQSRPLALFVQKYKAICNTKNIMFVLINHFRNKINPKLGTIKKRFGVKILDYVSTIILEIEKIPNQSNNYKFAKLFDKSTDGETFQFKIIKCKNHLKNSTYPFFLNYNKGISNLQYIIVYLLLSKAIVKKGVYFEYELFNIKEKGMINFIEKFKPKVTEDFLRVCYEYFKTNKIF